MTGEKGGKMGGRYVLRLHDINVNPSRNKFTLKMSLKGTDRAWW